MNFVIRSSKALGKYERPLHHRKLGEMLAILEVEPLVKSNWKNSDHRRYFAVEKASEAQLWNYLESCRNNHRRLIRQHHPDRGGSHEKAAIINAAWLRAKDLFTRKGIAYA